MTPNASEFFKPDNNIEKFLFGSFYIRITETWPLFFESVITQPTGTSPFFSALIASSAQLPSRINPIRSPERATVRRNWILGRMYKLG